MAKGLKEFLNGCWEKFHYTIWVTGGCSTCQWPEQQISSIAWEEFEKEMDKWIEETYGKKN